VKELDLAIEAARQAGAIVRSLYGTGLPAIEKGDRGDSPLTAADTRANEALRRAITEAFPDDGWLSEESRDTADRLAKRRVWIVDPLDGTKEFVRTIPELAVCVALVDDGIPIVGVTYNPIREEMFAAARGGGARYNGERVRVSEVSELRHAVVLASRSETERGEWERFRGRFGLEVCGSVAYKLARIAAGRGDATFSLTPKNEWDICSSACLVECAGGRVTDLAGEPLRYNRQNPSRSGLIASNGVLHEELLELVRR
jgi:myo-inositol-1(or 4)-monophosphatase